ncbi:MAG: tetratricopeptide repeat protein [Verrucomicrobiota bacterium]
MKTLRLFLSSPGDVAQERRIAERVIARLDAEFSTVKLAPYFWEYEPMVITKDYQEQIPAPSEFDIVICILWSRMGSRMHTKYQRQDGTAFRSGTEYEFVDAVEGQKRNDGTPDVLVWINKTQPLIPLEPEEAHMERLRQWRELKAFLEEWTRDGEEGTFKGAVNRYGRLDEFEEKLEVKLRKLIEGRLDGGAEETASDAAEIVWKEGSPFRGLQAFEFEHAPVFFGRTAAVAEAIESLRRQGNERGSSFLMVAGASGSGKSSLVRAGVVPMLVEPGVMEGVGLWRRAIMRPGDGEDPFASVAAAMLTEEALPEMASDGTDIEELAKMLRESPEQAIGLGRGALSQAAALVHASEKAQLEERIAGFEKSGRNEDAESMRKRLEKLSPPSARLVLVVDQFEEIFSEKIDDEVKQRFVRLVSALAGGGRIAVIATIRSDFFPHCADFPELLELTRGDGILQLGPPTPAELGQMIRQPAQAAGLRFESDAATGESLDEVLRDAAVDQPTVLPLLGFCLQQLYEERRDGRVLTMDAYKKLGGVEGAVAQRAEDVFGELSEEMKAEFPRLMRATVTIGGVDDDTVTRRRADYAQLTSSSSMKVLVDALVAARLFVVDGGEGGAASVSVAHEALLRSWPRMAEAIDDDREFLRGRARLSRAAKRWDEEGRDAGLLLPAGKQLEEGRDMCGHRRQELSALEVAFVETSVVAAESHQRKRLRRLQGIAAGFAILALGAGLAGFYAWEKQKEAEERRAQAVELRAGADELISSALYDLRSKLTPLGRIDVMEDVSEKAEAYFARIPDELKDDVTERQRGTVLNWRGTYLLAQGETEAAKQKFEESLEISRELRVKHPNETIYTRDISVSLANLANLARRRGDLETAETHFREILSMRELGENPSALEVLDRVDTLLSIGDVFRDRGNWEEASKYYEESVETGENVVFDPELRAQARNIPAALGRLASAKLNTGNGGEALKLFEQAYEISSALADDFPDELLFKADVSIYLGHLARSVNASGDAKRARELYDERLELARYLIGEAPGDVSYTIDFLHAINGAGAIRMLDPTPDEYIALYREGAAVGRDIAEKVPDLNQAKNMLATNLNGLAFGLVQAKEFEEAVKVAEESLAVLDSVENLDQFIRLSYEAAFNYLMLAHQNLGKTQDDMKPILRRGLDTALRFKAAGLSDEKMEASIQQVREILGEAGE